MSEPSSAYLLERAWVDGAVRDDVLVEIADGRITAVTPAAPAGDVPSREARSVACVVMPSTKDDSDDSVAQRASSQAVTCEGTALVPLGSTATLPNVTRASASRACLLAPSAANA